MHVLMVHNKYLQPGGEDISTEAELTLLRITELMSKLCM